MPTVTLSLGRYVVLKKRADGTSRAYFQVPARLRPSGWSPAIPLPRTAERRGTLDAAEVAAIKKDAEALYGALMQAKTGDIVRPPERSLSTLVDALQRSPEWAALSEKTRVGYETGFKKILAWSKSCSHPDPSALPRSAILQFLSSFDAGTEPDGTARVARHTAKKHTAAVLRLVLEQAINKGWRTDNPARGIRIKVPKTKATIWEQKDVDCYVKAARDTGVPSIALIILLEWEIGQRLTDVRAFRPGAEYDAERGVFSFRQSKTDEPVSIEVSMGLRAMLAEAGDGHLFLFRNDRTGKAYTENRLSKTFAWVRVAAVKAGGRPLILKQLRHSCIVQLARAGCTVPEIAAITGHALTSVNSILSVYLPRDTAVARAAQVKRGIVSA
jgi:integrase